MKKTKTKLGSKRKKKAPAVKTNAELDTVAFQSLLLGADELLVYKDEEGEYHILCKEKYDPKKDYQVLYMTYEDIK
jgi:hypothetical protein